MSVKEYTLAIVCPMANERETAEDFTRDLLNQCSCFKAVDMFAILDQASRDGTKEIMEALARQDSRIHVVWSPENRNVVDAYIRGYHEALNSGADWILEIDAGYSHDPKDIKHFIPHIHPDIDCIFGSRFCEGGAISNSSTQRFLISRIGSISSRWLLGTRLNDMTSGYEMFSRKALQAVLDRGICSQGHFFQTEIKAYCKNMRYVEVPIHYQNASGTIPGFVLLDAIKGLIRLFSMRLRGQL